MKISKMLSTASTTAAALTLFSACTPTSVVSNYLPAPFIPLHPPTTFNAPGTLVFFEKTNGKPHIGTICAVGGEHRKLMRESITEEASIISQKSLNGNVTIAPNDLVAINKKLGTIANASLSGVQVKTVYQEFKNAKLLQVSFQHLSEIEAALKQSPSCQDGIERAMQDPKRKIATVYQVYQADVTYKVEFETKLNAETEITAMKIVNLELNGSYDSSGNEIRGGKGLFFAAALDPNPS